MYFYTNLHLNPPPQKKTSRFYQLRLGLRIRIRIIFGSWTISALQWKAKSGSTLKSNSETLQAKNSHVRSKWRPGSSKWSPEASIDRWSPNPVTLLRSRIWIRIKVKGWIRIRMKVKAGYGSAINRKTGSRSWSTFKWKAGSGTAFKCGGSPSLTAADPRGVYWWFGSF